MAMCSSSPEKGVPTFERAQPAAHQRILSTVDEAERLRPDHDLSSDSATAALASHREGCVY